MLKISANHIKITEKLSNQQCAAKSINPFKTGLKTPIVQQFTYSAVT